MPRERKEVSTNDRWNVEALYPSIEAWQQEYTMCAGTGESRCWPQIQIFRGTLAHGAEVLSQALSLFYDCDRHLAKLYTYAHLRHDEDLALTETKEMFDQITMLYHAFQQECAWIEPEILAIPRETLQNFLLSPVLDPYRVYLDRVVRCRPHMLDASHERLYALARQALDAPSKAFSAFNNADLHFPRVLDATGQEHELTHAAYTKFLRGDDRVLRKNAFLSLHRAFGAYENTLSELISGQAQRHFFHARARSYPSCMAAALFPHEVDPRVYHQLIEVVRDHLDKLHRYIDVRKRVMDVPSLHTYDLQSSLAPGGEVTMDYDTAVSIVIESVAPLGAEYQNTLRRGLIENRWVDRYENARKRSGAYSSGCYDSMPYILMNYNTTFQDVSTLAHECGHSMHSWLSRCGQPYQYAQYPIFLAEIASTFNEQLLYEHLMRTVTNHAQKVFLVHHQIDTIRATFFRQTMFAEFELRLHMRVEQGMPLTAHWLKETYATLHREYAGGGLTEDPETAWEWARIPHFYYDFYVYQYATGISAATCFAEQIGADQGARDRYLAFLSAGCSTAPLKLLAKAGVDMGVPGPILCVLQRFDMLVDQLEKLLNMPDLMDRAGQPSVLSR